MQSPSAQIRRASVPESCQGDDTSKFSHAKTVLGCFISKDGLADICSQMHNNKQSKVPLREEGVDPIKATERIMWISEKGKGETYIDFHPNHWEDLKIGRAQL